MAKFTMHLSIGYAGADHEEEIEIDDDELASCEDDFARERLKNSIVREWANDYIETYMEEAD